METTQKQIISEAVLQLSKQTSQAKVAKQASVSTALISQIINGKWDLISDEMWSNIQVTLRIDAAWITAEIENYKIIKYLVKNAQDLSISIAFSAAAGKGKTHALSDYQRTNPNVIYIECKNYWSKKSYIKQLLINSGLSSLGTTEELINRFVSHLKGKSKPALIIDQFDKLKDPQLDLFMDFYNDLNGHCAFILSGVEHFEKRIEKGVNKNKIGYAELYSRIGRKFIKLDPITLKDVESICYANGVTEAEEISFIYNNCEDDLRRVRRDIDKYKLKLNARQSA